jgi:hypothetical protein
MGLDKESLNRKPSKTPALDLLFAKVAARLMPDTPLTRKTEESIDQKIAEFNEEPVTPPAEKTPNTTL